MRVSIARTWQEHRTLLLNALSLVGSGVVTSSLGFFYWFFAARLFPVEAVGLASALVSAMSFLGLFSVFGLGTLLVGELPQHRDKTAQLLSFGIIIASSIGILTGLAFILIAPHYSKEFRIFRLSPVAGVVFISGVALTALVMVLDQALIGLLVGRLQFIRNTIFAALKLGLLIGLGYWGWITQGPGIYATWVMGIALSLLPFLLLIGTRPSQTATRSRLNFSGIWQFWRKALQHHFLNLALVLPVQLLPLLVTLVLSVRANAIFYITYMLANIMFLTILSLTTVLYATNSGDVDSGLQRTRLTLIVSMIVCLAVNLVFQLAPETVLSLFGPQYAQEGVTSLRLLSLAAFPEIIRSHFIAISRLRNRLTQTFLIILLSSTVEITASIVGIMLGGLNGLCLGWTATLYVEALLMSTNVLRAASFTTLRLRDFAVVATGWLLALTTTSFLPPPTESGAETTLPAPPAEKQGRRRSGWAWFAGLLAVGLFGTWFWSVRTLNLGAQNDLGLVSAYPLLALVALGLYNLLFSVVLRLERDWLAVLYFVLMVFILYGITAIVEPFSRFSVVYRHAGYTEFIIRTGSVNPNLDAYFNWPGFFVLLAFFTDVVGLKSILPYAAWAPVFLNLLYVGALFPFLRLFTADRRAIWLAIWFFLLTNWIGQDYISPQGLNFFFYLVIVTLLLRFLPPRPDARPFLRLPGRLGRWYLAFWKADLDTTPTIGRQTALMVVVILLIFAMSVFSHPLTPFFILLTYGALLIFGKARYWWLFGVMIAMEVAWVTLMTRPYLIGHFSDVFGGLGNVGSSVGSNLIDRIASGNPDHLVVVGLRVVMTGLIWLLGLIGYSRRLRHGHADRSLVLLALVPFPLLVAQSYGGEMLLRIYLFSLPSFVLCAAFIWFRDVTASMDWRKLVTISLVTTILLGGFLFTRYGNERMDYMTANEINAVAALYQMAPKGSLLLEGWDGTPWKYQAFEQYTYSPISDLVPQAVVKNDVASTVTYIQSHQPALPDAPAATLPQGHIYPAVYIIFTRGQRATVDATAGLPPGGLDRYERGLLLTGDFQLVYTNPDADILLYTGGTA